MHPPKFLYRAHVKEEEKNPLLYLSIQSMDKRHIIDTHGHELIDCSTQGYLGFDHHEAIIEAQKKGLDIYANVVPWSRSVAIFDIFERVESRLADLVKAPSANLFVSTTLLSHGVLAALGGAQVTLLTPTSSLRPARQHSLLLMNTHAYMASFEGALLAQGRGSDVAIWYDMESLEAILKQSQHGFKLIVMDGVHSMGGFYADLPAFHALASTYNAYLFVDDAHGFGVIGEGGHTHISSYGHFGNGIVRYYELDYERIIYVGCLSKAYGLPGAFLACSQVMKEFMLLHATPHDLGMAGQGSVMMGMLCALDLNAAVGNEIRARLYHTTQHMRQFLKHTGYILFEGEHIAPHIKCTNFPIITILIPEHKTYMRLCQHLYDQGVLVTPEPFGVTNSPVGDGHLLRITITEGLTPNDIDHVCHTFASGFSL